MLDMMNATHTGAEKMTHEDQISLQKKLIQYGSVLANVGHCGEDQLPCGVCDECLRLAESMTNALPIRETRAEEPND